MRKLTLYLILANDQEEPIELGFIDASEPLEPGELGDLQHEAWVIIQDEIEALEGSFFQASDGETGTKYDLAMRFTQEYLNTATTEDFKHQVYTAVAAFTRLPEHLK